MHWFVMVGSFGSNCQSTHRITAVALVSPPATAASPFAVAPRAELQRLADVAARAAVGAVPPDVRTAAATILSPFGATSAHAVDAVGIGARADVSACTAVVGIGIQHAAYAVAHHRTLDAGIMTGAVDALAKLVRTGIGATEAAASAVVKVVLQIGTVGPATGLSVNAAVVAASAAVWVGSQVAARAVASRGGTTGVIAT